MTGPEPWVVVPGMSGDRRWYKVSFYGQMPHGECITDVDPLDVAATLASAFGFTAVDALTVTSAERSAPRRPAIRRLRAWWRRRQLAAQQRRAQRVWAFDIFDDDEELG